MSIRECKTIESRIKFLRKETRMEFSAINFYPENLKEAQNRNCENMIGAVQVPLGIAGPLTVKGKSAKGKYFLPLATTEGALVASVNRGCKAISAAGGAVISQEYVGISRGCLLRVSSLSAGLELSRWINTNLNALKELAATTSSHVSLLKAECSCQGRNLYVRFSYDTQDAMGMNMVTFATAKICEFLEENKKVKCLALAANYDTDKKPSFLNFILGRGRKVWAEVELERKIIKEVLKTTPEKIHDVAINKCYLGSIISGSMGYNGHFANIIAALYIACGQDAAHVVEGSLGITSTELTDKGLYFCVYLPDLPLGTVGGGTVLPAQKEALQLLGVAGGNKGKNCSIFAEISAAAVLAGEISLLGALSAGDLAKAHRKLARGDR